MNAAGNLSNIRTGTAKTFEHMASDFKFRVAGDGAVENKVVDQFSPTAPIVESINQRSLRAFIAAEHQMTQETSAPANKEEGQKALDKLANDMLGEGWTAESYYDYSERRPGPDRTVVKYTDGGASQTIDIEHRGNEQGVRVDTKVREGAWSINHSIEMPLVEGNPQTDDFVETAYFKQG